MAGPYVVNRLTDNRIFDGRIAWGQSDNEISPFNTYTDKFSTDLWLIKGQFTGDFKVDKWRINPNLAVLYFNENFKEYRDIYGIIIDQQDVKIGQAVFGPRISKAFITDLDVAIIPSLAVRGIWDFDTPGTMDLTAGTLSGLKRFRARTEAGLNIGISSGTTVKFDGFYDGFGAD